MPRPKCHIYETIFVSGLTMIQSYTNQDTGGCVCQIYGLYLPVTAEIMHFEDGVFMVVRYEQGDKARNHHKLLVTEDGPVSDVYEEDVNEEPWMYAGSFNAHGMVKHVFISE
jgi:hypothetical protein